MEMSVRNRIVITHFLKLHVQEQRVLPDLYS